MRTDLSGGLTFRQLLDRVRRTTLEAFDHQDYPFEKLVEQLHPERHRSRSPIIQVLFQLLTLPSRDLHLAGLDVDGAFRPADSMPISTWKSISDWSEIRFAGRSFTARTCSTRPRSNACSIIIRRCCGKWPRMPTAGPTHYRC